MRHNKYISSIVHDGRRFIVNYLDGKVAELQEELYVLYEAKTPDEMANLHPQFYAAMVRDGFYVDDDFDEVKIAEEGIRQALASKETLRVIVNPTMDCNLRCWYCYESHTQGGIATPEVVGAIKKYLARELADEEVKNLELDFFGGEPLIGFKQVVQPICDFAVERVRLLGKEVRVGFTTNAVLLTEEVTDYLASLGVSVAFQIPFDGGREMHNKTKRMPDGGDSYNISMQHVKCALAKGMHVTLRCNYTMKNLASFASLLDDIEQIPDKHGLNVLWQRIWQETNSLELQENVRKLQERSNKLTGQSEKSSSPYRIACYADYDAEVIINYNGNVSKCTARDFKPSDRLGVLQPNGTILKNEKWYRRRERLIREECLHCKLLPICPECSQRRSEMGSGGCTRFKDSEQTARALESYMLEAIQT